MTLVSERPILNLRYTSLYAQCFSITVKVKYYKLNCPDESLTAHEWQPCEEKVSAHCVPSTVLPSIWYDLNALSHHSKGSYSYVLKDLSAVYHSGYFTMYQETTSHISPLGPLLDILQIRATKGHRTAQEIRDI